MKTIYSVEVDKYNPMALAHCLKLLADGIPDFEYDWTLSVNASGIDYGIYLNIDIDAMEITISNQPQFGTDGNDMIEDILKNFEEDEGE